MLYTAVDTDYILRSDLTAGRRYSARSSNPYDYIRQGYYLDNAVLFGGNNNVIFNCNFRRSVPCNRLDFSD